MGQPVALGDRAPGHARTTVAPVIEEPAAGLRSGDGAGGASGTARGSPERANRAAEYGPDRSGGSDGGVDGELAGRGPFAAVGVDRRRGAPLQLEKILTSLDKPMLST